MIADIVAVDREDRPVLMAEVDVAPREGAVSRFLAELSAAPETVAFGMFVDPWTIRIYRRGEDEPAAEFDAVETLRHYSPDYGPGVIRETHPKFLGGRIATLAESWLRDVAFPFFPGVPPRLEELGRVGLLPLLKNTSIDVEVPLVGYALR
jgi:hypothetical protein